MTQERHHGIVLLVADQEQTVEENIEKGKVFLAANAMNDPDVKTTSSGLQYKMVKSGNGYGRKPCATDKVEIHYTIKLIDGRVIDSAVDGTSIIASIHDFISGLQEGIQLMERGATYMFYIPYYLAYGTTRVGAIPPGSTLICEVQLLEINP